MADRQMPVRRLPRPHPEVHHLPDVAQRHFDSQSIGIHVDEPVAPVCDVNLQLADPGYGKRCIQVLYEGRHAAEGDRHCASVFHLHHRFHHAGRRLEPDAAAGSLAGRHSQLDQHRRDSDGGVAAHVQVAAVVHEEHAELGIRPRRFGQHAAEHVLVPPGFRDQRGAEMILMTPKEIPLFQDRFASQMADPAGDDPSGLPLSVGIHRVKPA